MSEKTGLEKPEGVSEDLDYLLSVTIPDQMEKMDEDQRKSLVDFIDRKLDEIWMEFLYIREAKAT